MIVVRIVAFVVAVLVSSVLSTGAAVFTAVEFSRAPHGILLAAGIGSAFLVYGPLVIGSIAGWWDHRSSDESRRWIGRWFIGVLLVDVAVAVVVVLAAVEGGAPVWVPIVVIAGAAVLLGVARPVGAAFRRSERPSPEPESWQPFSTSDVHRGVRTIGVVFAAAVVLSSVGFVALGDSRGDARDVLESVLLGVQLTFTVTAFAAIIVSVRFSTALRETADRDLGRLRRFGKVVLGGKDLPLDEAEQRGAARFAAVTPITSGFQLAYIGFLYAGISASTVGQLLRDDGFDRTYAVVILALFVAVLVWLVPVTVRRIRRARAYAAAHADLLGSPAPTAATGWTGVHGA